MLRLSRLDSESLIFYEREINEAAIILSNQLMDTRCRVFQIRENASRDN